MSLQLGNFRLPTVGDAVNGVEATIGNIVEGIIEGTTGAKVELTPGNGVDNTKARGPSGREGELRFDKPLASYEDTERLRKESEKSFRDLADRLARVEVKQKLSERRASQPAIVDTATPGLQPFQMQGLQPQQAAPSSAQNLLPLVLLSQQGGGFQNNPLAMMMLMQSMQSMSVGHVGANGQLQMDPTSFAMMQLLTNTLMGSTKPQRVISTPADTGGGNG